VNSGQKIQFLGFELASFLDKKSNENSKVLILGFELASFLDKKSRPFSTVNPYNFQKYFYSYIVVLNVLECVLVFLSENDASSVPKIRFFKKSPNLYTINRVGFFVQK